MTSADSAKSGRDFGLSLSVSVIVIAFVLALTNAYLPEGITAANIGAAGAVGGACALASAITTWLFLRDYGLNIEIPVAVTAAVILYAISQACVWLYQTRDYRDAVAAANGWTTEISQNYSHVTAWTPSSSTESAFGTQTTQIQAGVFYVSVSSNRDETALTGPDGKNQPQVGSDFFLQADVTTAPGATDGRCALVFGFTVSEHWFAATIGPGGVGLTQDFGGVDRHRDIYGPQSFKYAHSEHNLVSVLSKNGKVELFVNRQLVTIADLVVPRGNTWIAPQAANRPDTVRCGYDNYELYSPG